MTAQMRFFCCHLGSAIGSNMDSQNISKSINEFVSNINRIKSCFSYVDTEILYKLLKSYCVPLYGCTLWDFSLKNVLRFFTTWHKSLRSLIKLPHRTHSWLLPHIVADRPVEVQLHNRFINFLKSVKNILLKLGFQLSISGSCSSVSNSYVYIKKSSKRWSNQVWWYF